MLSDKASTTDMISKKILLVDDDIYTREIISLGLSKMGFNVEQAVDGESGIQLLKVNEYDLVISDLIMREIGGLEIAAWVETQGLDIPIIIITGYADVESAVGALQHRIDDYIIKPVDINNLVLRISHSIEKTELNRQLRQRQKMLEYRDEMLQVINLTAADLLVNPGDGATVDRLLRRMGEILTIDRVSHYEAVSIATRKLIAGRQLRTNCRLCFQWLNDKTSDTDAVETIHADNPLQEGHWLTTLVQGKEINGAVADFQEQKPMPPVLGCSSNLLLWPIRHGNRFFGFIGFERQNQDHPWSLLETESLRMAAMILAGAGHRLDIETRLAAALDQARTADKAKSDFLANMSHEIRTPINSITGMAELLKETELDQRQHEYLFAIRHSSNELFGLLENILDFADAKTGDLKIMESRFDLSECLRETVDIHAAEAEAKGLSLILELDGLPSCGLAGDSQRLRQVLSNIIGNSIKFTRQGKIIVRATSDGRNFLPVRCHPGEKDRTVCYFSIKDEGEGIRPDKLSHIFDLFSQADGSLTRNHGGTGIGLALCRCFVVLMGGRIAVRSRSDRGSEFFFSIPFGKLDDRVISDNIEKMEGKVVKADEPVNFRILLVEDNLLNRELAIIILQRNGHRVTIAENGAEALKLLAKNDYDRILMDVQMPVMDGLTATEIIRLCEQGKSPADVVDSELANALSSRLRGKHLPIIALTANAMSEDKDRCMAAGMDAYLTKPFQPAMIASTLAGF